MGGVEVAAGTHARGRVYQLYNGQHGACTSCVRGISVRAHRRRCEMAMLQNDLCRKPLIQRCPLAIPCHLEPPIWSCHKETKWRFSDVLASSLTPSNSSRSSMLESVDSDARSLTSVLHSLASRGGRALAQAANACCSVPYSSPRASKDFAPSRSASGQSIDLLGASCVSSSSESSVSSSSGHRMRPVSLAAPHEPSPASSDAGAKLHLVALP
mmetsp:Transcript_14997/g.40265  ORF Transcript_14997/g.40265 Transcript_14997/m.40265 type:complete len:213 (-) Transcript_14997:293-931(-)